MITYKSFERKIESEIAALRKTLARFVSKPIYTLDEKHVISVDFNGAVMRDLPRRQGLERRLSYYERRLHSLRMYPAYTTDFALVA